MCKVTVEYVISISTAGVFLLDSLMFLVPVSHPVFQLGVVRQGTVGKTGCERSHSQVASSSPTIGDKVLCNTSLAGCH